MSQIFRKYPILAYYARKVFTYFLTIFGALTITFFMFRLIPSNPVQNWVNSLRRTYSVSVDDGGAMVANYKEKFGMN